ncbi:hypothetical protein ABPG74_019211 [Tetrahymena malaccensis]
MYKKVLIRPFNITYSSALNAGHGQSRYQILERKSLLLTLLISITYQLLSKLIIKQISQSRQFTSFSLKKREENQRKQEINQQLKKQTNKQTKDIVQIVNI